MTTPPPSGTGWLTPRQRDGGIDRVPFPPVAAATLPSTAGLSLCGKHAVAPDVGAALTRSGAHTVVCLVERHELAARYPAYVQWLEAAATDAVWHPVHDLHAPPLAEAQVLVDHLVHRLRRGEHLLVHCGAGIGRAGTIAACILVRLGMEEVAALAHVAAHRPMAGPEAGAQRELVSAIAAAPAS